MTASRAYIAGIGTTGVLIGFALLILAVVSALVAFRGWPGDTAADGAGAVTFGEGASLIEVEPVRMGTGSSAAVGAAVGAAGPGRAAASAEGSAGGRFDVRGVAESETAQLEPGSAPVGAPGGSGGSGGSGGPSVPATQEGGNVGGGLPQGAGGGLAEGVEEAAGAVGEVTAPVTTDAPAAGDGVGEALRGAGGAVKQKAGELGLP